MGNASVPPPSPPPDQAQRSPRFVVWASSSGLPFLRGSSKQDRLLSSPLPVQTGLFSVSSPIAGAPPLHTPRLYVQLQRRPATWLILKCAHRPGKVSPSLPPGNRHTPPLSLQKTFDWQTSLVLSLFPQSTRRTVFQGVGS